MSRSDEPYRRIRFVDHDFVSPAQVYPWTVVMWTLLRTSPHDAVSDSIGFMEAETNRCAVSLDFLTSTNA
jgi:hypothetical protein